MSYLSAFNTQLENFINELSELFPKDTDIAFAKNTIYLLKKTNPKKTSKIFKSYMNKFEDQINNKNEDFFLNRNYNDIHDGVKSSLNTVMNLKKYWKSMTNNTRNNIWLYLQILIKISKKI